MAIPPATAVRVLEVFRPRPSVEYWRLRGWRQIDNGLYLGYFKTPLGRRHEVIRWRSPWDFTVCLHDVPDAILRGPHGACFSMVKPGKHRMHFAQAPGDLNSLIFYLETLIQEALKHERAQ